jgi:hypothetical protein
MAKIIIEFADVIRTHKGGFTVVEIFKKRDGSEGKNYFKVWSDEQVEVGLNTHIEGLVSSKVSTFTNKQGETVTVSEIHVNNPKLSKIGYNAPRNERAAENLAGIGAEPVDEALPF